MAFKKCIWKNGPNDNVEYEELKTGNKFVTLKTIKKVKREIVQAKGPDYGKYQDVTLKKDLLVVQYPHEDITSLEVKANEKDKYYLVVNHTAKWARPILKSLFHHTYTKGSNHHTKVQGDSGMLPGDGRTDPDKDAKAKASAKAKAHRK